MRPIFKSGTFEDYEGRVRRVTICCVPKDSCCGYTELLIGVAVQNPKDFDDLELSKVISKGKAIKYKSRCAQIDIDTKFLNIDLIESILNNIFAQFKNNPGKFLKGYNKDKELYEKDPYEYKAKFDL